MLSAQLWQVRTVRVANGRANGLCLSRVRPYRTRLRDAMRRAKRGAEAPGQTDGRTSAPGKSWPAQTHWRVNDRAWQPCARFETH